MNLQVLFVDVFHLCLLTYLGLQKQECYNMIYDKLYLIQTAGLSPKKFYVIAPDPTTAYNKLRSLLDEQEYGFEKDRELLSITTIADEDFYISHNLLIKLNRERLVR